MDRDSFWKLANQPANTRAEKLTTKNRLRVWSELRTYRKIFFSLPGYARELSQLRDVSELFPWLYFKTPNLFPLRKVPTYVTVEPTTVCNLLCVHCWRFGMERAIESMDLSLFKKIVAELATMKPLLFKFGGSGEPSLHPQFRELMALTTPLKLRVFVYTNGSLLRIFSPAEILKWELDTIVVSIDGLDEKEYEDIKIGSKHAEVKQLIQAFCNYREAAGVKSPTLEVRHIIMPNETAAQTLEFTTQWLKIADTVRYNTLIPADGLSELEDPAPPKCRQIRREMLVLCDGRVSLCGGHSNKYIGNVRESSISELWLHPELQHLRHCNDTRNFSESPLCKRCLSCR